MVAALLSLRWRIIRHQYRRDWWRILSLAAGLIWSFSAIPTLLFAAQELSFHSSAVRHDALVGLGAVLGLGWVAVPLLVSGVDDALDPTRFAAWGVRARTLVPGLAIAAFTTLPAAFFVGLGFVFASVWRREEHAVAVQAVGLAGSLLAVASWVIGARLAALWGARVLTARWGRAALAAIAAGVVMAMVATVAVARADGLDSFVEYEFAVAVRQLALTPAGAGLAAPAHLADADVAGAAWRIAMAAAWLGLVLAAWRAAVAHALVHPLTRPAGGAREADAIVSAATRPDVRGRIVQAVRARSLRSWRTDPRYVAQVVGTLATPVLFAAIAVAGIGVGKWLLVVPVVVAVMIGWARHNDLAYESTALWIDLVAGARGADVMRGRQWATLSWSAPVVAVAATLVCGLTGMWWALPAVIAASLGALGVSVGVAAAMSVLLPYRVPAPGENPFSTEVGSIGASLASQALSSLATGAVLPLVGGPLVAALVWGGPWWVVAFAVGAVVAPLGALGGERIAGRVWDAKAGRLVGAVS